MANTLFMSGRQGFLDGSIDWDTNTIKVLLVSKGANGNGYPAVTDITFLTQIPDSAKVRFVETALGAKTVASGIADADDCTASAVSAPNANSAIGSIIIYADSGSPSTSRLIAYIDTATGLPCSANGGDIQLSWANTTSRIFML